MLTTLTSTMAVALAALMLGSTAQAQSCSSAAPSSGPRSAASQPRIMVIPFTKQGEDIRTVLDNDFGRQLAIAKVKEAFDDRQFPTVDFMGAVDVLRRGQVMSMESESDFRDRLLQTNQADIYVVSNFRPNRTAEGLTTVTLILESRLTANGQSLGSKSGTSPSNRLSDTTAHIQKVVGQLAGPLLDVMQTRFCEFQSEGIPLSVDFRVATGAVKNLQSQMPGKDSLLNEVVESWFAKHAFKGGYAIANSTQNLMQLTDVRIAIRDENGRPASPARFGTEIARFLRSIGIATTTSVSNGAIYVQLN